MTRHVYSIPTVPPSLNVWKRMHWSAQEKARLQWQESLWALLNEAGNKCPRNLERVRIRAVLTFTTRRRRDSDNFLTPMNKWTQDALVNLGIIPDDTHDRCTFEPPGIVVGPSEQTFLVIEGKNRTEES